MSPCSVLFDSFEASQTFDNVSTQSVNRMQTYVKHFRTEGMDDVRG